MSNFAHISYNSPVFSGIHTIAMNPKRSDHRGYPDRIYFPDEPILRGKKIKSVMVYANPTATTTGANGYWMDSTPISSDILSLSVTFCDQERFEFMRNYPCYLLSAYNQQFPIDRPVDLLDSYISLRSANYDDITYLFVFFYEQINQSYNQRGQTNFDNIEFQISTTPGIRSMMPNYPPLQDKRIRNILIQANSLSGDIETPNGYPIADLKSKYISLMYQRDILFYRVPAEILYQFNDRFRLRMADILVTLSNCYVETSPADTNLVAGNSMMLSFEYLP